MSLYVCFLQPTVFLWSGLVCYFGTFWFYFVLRDSLVFWPSSTKLSTHHNGPFYCLQKDRGISPLTIEADTADVLEEFLPSSQIHLGADAGVLWTQVSLHVVEGVGHGVHRVDHKLNLTLLLVLGVNADALLTWERQREYKVKDPTAMYLATSHLCSGEIHTFCLFRF